MESSVNPRWRKLPHLDPLRATGELCRRRFFRFFCEFWETIEAVPLQLNWHIEYICDQLQEVYEAWESGEAQPDVLINLPPGCSKSTIVTQLWPAWIWVRCQYARIITSSYAADLATAHAVKTRDCLKSEKFKQCYGDLIEFKNDSDGKTHYKNTKKGERFVTSTGGRVTGMHGDFLINDDPLNPEEAASDQALKRAARFLGQTLSTRKTDKKRSVTVLMMQRLHQDDPSGVWMKKKKLRRICLPGTNTKRVFPESLKSYYTDGLLDAVRLDREALDKLRSDLGSYGYSGQIDQDPAPESGGIWERWFVVIPDSAFPSPDNMKDYGTDWDTAYTDQEKNDSSAYCTSGKIGTLMYIDKLGHVKKEMPELIKFMSCLPDPHYIEQKASGKSCKQLLVDGGIPAKEVPVTGGDKIARTRNATPKVEAGLVAIRESILQTLYEDAEQGILVFPNGTHDDLNDAVVQAIQRHFAKKKTWY